ncbi:MAG: redox-regulated ATPase YchF [Acidimicrobiia bacterium]|nr:redox-regulated ATPase YchF [Acidimicrobiia bacterium]
MSLGRPGDAECWGRRSAPADVRPLAVIRLLAAGPGLPLRRSLGHAGEATAAVTLTSVERLSIVGLPNAGKSSLFNALTGGDAAVAAHPFSTTETNVGVAEVPDRRVDILGELSHSKKLVHATVEFVDIAALVAGAAGGEGLGNRFLGGIREVDAMVLVLRAFEDPNVVGGTDGTDPLADLQTLELELVLADVATLESQLDKRRKAAKGDKSLAGEVAVMEKTLAELGAGTPVYRSSLAAEEREVLRPMFLLTNKPVLAVVNVGEDQLGSTEELVRPVQEEFGAAAEVLGVSVQLEAEAAQLPADERAELLDGLGLGEGALPRVARAAYHLLGRRTFLTTGDKESRAWTFRAGAKAPEAAGVIHSDLQRGFIRAEVIAYDDLVEAGTWQKAKETGRLRVEGKDYEVQDGDVVEIRFNV